MFGVLFLSFVTHAARPICKANMLGSQLRRIKVADDREILRQRDLLTQFKRALPKTLKTQLPGFAQQRFARVIEVEADDQAPDLYPGFGPRVDGDYEAWLTLPGRLVKQTDVGVKPTPFADEILSFAASQELRADLYHWQEKELYDGVRYGQWYHVTARVTKPAIPPEIYGRTRPGVLGPGRRREPDERYFSLAKGQPPTYVRLSWR